MRRAARSVERAKPLRHDALAAERAGVLVDRGAVALIVLVQRDAVMRQPQQPGEPAFADLDRLAADILAVHLEQIEGAKDGTTVAPVTADQVEDRHPAVVAYDCLGIDYARLDRECQDRRGCQRKAIG
jgi:hypothetical protein